MTPTDYLGKELFIGDVLLNTFFGDLWTVVQGEFQLMIKLNTIDKFEPIKQARSFYKVAENCYYKERFIPNIKYELDIVMDKEGRKVKIPRFLNLRECLLAFSEETNVDFSIPKG